MAQRDRSFDPRFDPAFQRGFEASDGRSSVTARPAQRENSSVVPSARAEVASGEPESSAGAEVVVGAPQPAGEVVVAPRPGLRGNPWVRVLWAVAGVSVAAGIAAQAIAQSFYLGGGTSTTAWENYVLPTLLATFSPWLFGAGLAAAIGTLFLHAARWREDE